MSQAVLPKACAALRMKRYRARKTFERVVAHCLRWGIPQEELEDLVGFVATGVKMRFHPKPGRPSNVTPARYDWTMFPREREAAQAATLNIFGETR